MANYAEPLEQRFWSKVWRCTHSHPCTQCCWPWLAPYGLYCAMAPEPYFFDTRLHPTPALASPRVAYLLTTGATLFPSRYFHLCHQCDYKACCNYAHIFPGSASDNHRDRARRPAKTHPAIQLPDGRELPYDYHQYRQGLSGKPSHRRRKFGKKDIFCLYANDYEGTRGYPITDALCQMVSPTFLGKEGTKIPAKERTIFLRQLGQYLSMLTP